MPPHSLATRKVQMQNDVSAQRRFFSGLEPGMRVRHPDRSDWGAGQVQSVIGHRVTVNFEQVGKVLVDARVIALTVIEG